MQHDKILLVGCGQLGSRHLQAVGALDLVGEIHVVDSRADSLEFGKTRLKEITDQNPVIKFFWHTQALPCCAGGDLCIVATQANGRDVVVRDVASQLGYTKFLIEKIVVQSVSEYRDLMKFCDHEGIAVWVNCKTRAYGIHQYIKTKLDPQEPIFFSDVGGNHGLANNGVHSADLFAFYDAASNIMPVGRRIDPKLLPSKRGSTIFDLGGTLYGMTAKGSDFVLSFSSLHESPDQMTIMSPRGRFIVDHFQKFAYESYPDDGWQWHQIPIREDWAVSQMTKMFAREIMTNGMCTLPTLAECFAAHEFILGQLLPEFRRLGATEGDTCPVT